MKDFAGQGKACAGPVFGRAAGQREGVEAQLCDDGAPARQTATLLSLWQTFEGWQAFRDMMKSLLVDGVDRHLRRAKQTRIIKRANL